MGSPSNLNVPVDNAEDGNNHTTTATPDEKAKTFAANSSQAQLIRTLCCFSVAFFVCIIVFFYTRDIKTGIIRLQDILTMLNPLLLVPLFYLIFLVDVNQLPNAPTHILFLLLAIVYIHGDGYHLAANAIHRYEDGLSLGEQDLQDVVYLYDEELGHYYPYTGLVGLHLLWLFRQTHLPFEDTFGSCNLGGLIFFGLLHGFVLFIMFIEGKYGIPAIVFFVIVALYTLFQRRRLRKDPIFLFSLVYSITGLLLLIVWAVWQRGFPELTEAGLV